MVGKTNEGLSRKSFGIVEHRTETKFEILKNFEEFTLQTEKTAYNRSRQIQCRIFRKRIKEE